MVLVDRLGETVLMQQCCCNSVSRTVLVEWSSINHITFYNFHSTNTELFADIKIQMLRFLWVPSFWCLYLFRFPTFWYVGLLWVTTCYAQVCFKSSLFVANYYEKIIFQGENAIFRNFPLSFGGLHTCPFQIFDFFLGNRIHLRKVHFFNQNLFRISNF